MKARVGPVQSIEPHRILLIATFFKIFLTAWNVQKTLFDSRPTVAWPPTTVTWPFSDFFQKIYKLLETSKNCSSTVGWRLRGLEHCRVAVQRFFSKNFLFAWNVEKSCLTVGRWSRDLRPLSRDRSVTFFKKFPDCLKRRKNVVRQSADGRVTSDHCRVTVQWLVSKNFLIAWIVQKTLFDSRPTVAWPPTTVALRFSDFFQNFSKLLQTSEKLCLKVSGRSRDCPATLLPCFFRTALHTLAYVVFLVILLLSFRRTARPRIPSYRNGSILEILTSYQS